MSAVHFSIISLSFLYLAVYPAYGYRLPKFAERISSRPNGGRIPLPDNFDEEAYLAKVKAYRLPHNVRPKSYDLLMIPDLKKFTFEGNVTIKVTIAQQTNVILLHSHKLDILELRVSSPDSGPIESSYALLPATQMLNITTNDYLHDKQKFYIYIKFQGVLNDDNIGFYRSSYPTANGTKWIATTHFLPTFARMAFPCFDEPMFKAKFTISVIRYEHQRVVTNMPLRETSFPIKSLDNRVLDEFHTTLKMSVYGVAFVVSEFYFITDEDEEFWVWSKQEAIDDCDSALSIAIRQRNKYEGFTGIPYELPKIALVAIPDLNVDGGENYGLVTVREPFILSNASTYSAASAHKMSNTISNKFSHQWFGHYTTMIWWDNLWLEEGLALYFQYYFLNNTEWFETDVTHYSLSIDGIYNHRELSALVNTPEEIMELFDELNFHKVAAILRMMHNFLGGVFQISLQAYLEAKHEDGGVATVNDFFSAFEVVSLIFRVKMPFGVTVGLFMKQFLYQDGYPLVTVTRRNNTEAVDIIIKQSPYRSPRSRKEIPDQIWTIPISCARKRKYDMSRVIKVWSSNLTETVLENEVEFEEWCICNVYQVGYYRVNYDTENWNLITNQLNISPEEIIPSNRAQIIDDSYTLALDEHLPFLTALNILRYLKWERENLPWEAGLLKLRDLYTRFELTPLVTDLKIFAAEAIANVYNMVGLFPAEQTEETGSYSLSRARITLIKVACEIGLPNCVSQANFIYSNKTNNLISIPGDVKETVLCVAIRNDSSPTTWNHLWNFYRKSIFADERDTILSALGCTTNEEFHKQFLFKLIDELDDDIRKHNRKLVFKSVLQTHVGVTSALKFVKDMLPNLSRHKRAPEIVLGLLKSMKSVVKSREHVRLLDESIEKAEKLDSQKYDEIIISLKRTKKAARENTADYERLVPHLSRALNTYYNRPEEPPQKKSSAASTRIRFKFVIYLTISLITFSIRIGT